MEFLFLIIIFGLYLFFAIRGKKLLLLALLIFSSSIQTSLFQLGQIDFSIPDISYGFFLFSSLIYLILYSDIRKDHYNKLSGVVKIEKIMVLFLFFFLLIPFAVRLLYHQKIYENFYFSFFHCLRYVLLLSCLFIFSNIFTHRDIKYIPLYYKYSFLFVSIITVISVILKINYTPGFNNIYRVRGFFINSNLLAGFLTILFPYILYYSTIKQQNFKKALNILSIFFGILLMLLTYSKIGITLLFINLFVYFLFLLRKIKQKAKIKMIFTILLAFIFIILLSYYKNMGSRFFEFSGKVLQGKLDETYEVSRILLWKKGLKTIKKNVIFGTGFFTTQFNDNLNVFGREFKTYHSFYIDFISSNGLFAFAIIFLLLFKPPIKALIKGIKDKNPIYFFSLLSLMNIIILNLVENYLLNSYSVIFLMLNILLIRYYEKNRNKGSMANGDGNE